MQPRRRARIVVLQTLYEVDLTGHDALTAMQNRLAEDPLPDIALEFALDLLAKICAHQTALDAVIREIAPEWPPEQMPAIDRNVLRIAAYELLYNSGTPRKVAINEAVELAKLFGGENSSRFVNGALGTLAERLNEFARKQQSAS